MKTKSLSIFIYVDICMYVYLKVQEYSRNMKYHFMYSYRNTWKFMLVVNLCEMIRTKTPQMCDLK